MVKLIKRKGSEIVWEVWAEDVKTLSLMNYSKPRNMSKIITRDSFNKCWEEVTL